MLDESDLDLIKRARVLAAAGDRPADLREYTGEADNGMAYAVAFGEAARLLAELAGRLERRG